MGAHDVAASGQNALNTEAALGQAANTYEANIGPLLAAEGAEQKVNQQNKNATQLLTDKQALAALQSAKGEAAQAALSQIIGENNSLGQARASMAAQILGNNNALSQQDFSNQLAMDNAIAAAESMGLTANLDNAKTAYYASKANQAGNSPSTNPFRYYQQKDPSFLNSIADRARAAIYDPTTGQKRSLTQQQAWNAIAGVYRQGGMNPAPGTPSYQAAQSILNTWMNG
jgi:hypothetical protein